MTHTPKYHAMKQGTLEWHGIRCGIPTASNFRHIVTPQGKPTANAKRREYMCRLLCERMTGKPCDNFMSAAMQRGVDLEPVARDWYTLETGRDVELIGFVTHADAGDQYGASPDGMTCNRKIGLEIKCLLPHNHIDAIMQATPPDEYFMQVQGCLWMTGAEKWDLLLYAGEPELPKRIWDIVPDKQLHAAFDEHIAAFCAELREGEQRLIELGGIKHANISAALAEQARGLMGE